jgi:hypothetical protein
MKALLALFLATVLVLSGMAQALEIRQFDRMSDDDQIEFVDQLAQSVQDSVQGEQYARVKRFFQPKQPGETISGMGQFEMNLSLARIADLEAVAKNPKARRLEVEDVMYVTMEKNGIRLPKNFRPAASHFQAKNPTAKRVMTRQDADKALAETQAWVSRTVEASHRPLPTQGAALSDNEKAIAFFVALAALVAVARSAGGSDNSSSSGSSYDDHSSDPWWQQNGYATYHDAVRAACLGSTTAANPTWCD